MTEQNKQTFTAAIVQMRSGRSVADNLEQANGLIREAAIAGARYVLTPENTSLMELDPNRVDLEAQKMEGNSQLAMFQSLARELQICLHIGSLTIRPDKGKRLINRSVVISPKGQIIAHYDKIHLFDVDLVNGETYRESDQFMAGNKAVITPLPVGLEAKPLLGLSICYDLRFAALFRILAKSGAHLISIPAAFTAQTGKAHWHVLLRARAIETGCYILAAAQGGRHENGRSTYGHSLIISPWGEIIAQAGTEPQILVAELDLTKVAAARAAIPALTHDRPFEVVAPSSSNEKLASADALEKIK
ncbi:MAG: carbon-nitrogen hydrolase family protein [Hyphomicrobiaceae bacterium]|nr:carbon-nitrogen hydrolase family protein [Hyphomicrobiaceae bacterium]